MAVGVVGFFVGKFSQPSGEVSEAERLLSRADQVVQGKAAGTAKDGPRASSALSRRGGGPVGNSLVNRLEKMEDIVRGENALDRSRAMLSWIDTLSPAEFAEAVERFRGLGLTEARMGEYAMLLTAWAEADPTAALAYTREKTSGGMATDTVLTAWASRDPESAIAWAKANHEGSEPNPFMIGIIRGLVVSDPARATALLQELPFSSERGEALGTMLPHLLRKGGEAAKGWIASLADSRLRDGATARLAELMAGKDPEGTEAWLMANLGEASTRSVDEVYEAWATKDAVAAKAAFEKLPAGDARTRALRGLVTIEARKNPQAAAELMNQHPADINDRMVQHFVWNAFDEAPEVAVGQIVRMGAGRDQNRIYGYALDAWLDRDQAAAQSWINSASLPEPVLRRLAERGQP